MAQYYTTGSGVNHHKNNILNMKVSNKLHEAKAKHNLDSMIYLSSKLYLIMNILARMFSIKNARTDLIHLLNNTMEPFFRRAI